MTLVELLIGLALGLFLVTGGVALLGSQLNEHRWLLAEARLMQELRSALQAITRELRRTGYWGDAPAGLVLEPGVAAPPRTNPYQGPLQVAAPDGVRLRYSRDDAENHRVDLNEEFGLRLHRQAVETLLGGNWQALTDVNQVLVTQLVLTPRQDVVTLGTCDAPCPTDPASPCPPQLERRRVEVALHGRSTLDARIQRSLTAHVRLRNDVLAGHCP